MPKIKKMTNSFLPKLFTVKIKLEIVLMLLTNVTEDEQCDKDKEN